MAVPVIAGVISIISGGIARMLTVEGLKFIATRALLIGLFTLILPVVLYNVFTGILEEIMSLASSEISASGITAAVIQLTGVFGWVADHIKLPESLSIYLSACGLAFMLSFLRR